MKYKIALFSLVMFNLFLLTPALAEEGTSPYRGIREGVKTQFSSTPKVTPVKEMFKETREVQKTQRETMRSTIAVEKEQFNETALANIISMLNARLQNAISRLNKRAILLDEVASRVETRISQVETEKGITLTEARSYLAQAKTELTNAKALISAITISTVTTKEEFETEKASLKTQVEKAYQSLKKVSELLRKSVNSALSKSVSTTPKVKPTKPLGIRPSLNPTNKVIPIATQPVE